jgi:hypothetical protein
MDWEIGLRNLTMTQLSQTISPRWSPANRNHQSSFKHNGRSRQRYAIREKEKTQEDRHSQEEEKAACHAAQEQEEVGPPVCRASPSLKTGIFQTQGRQV